AQSVGRTAMMVPNLISAATSGPTEQEKAEGYAPGFGSLSDAAKTFYDRAVTLPVKHTVVDPSAAAYENVDQMARAQEARAQATRKPIPHPTAAKVAEYGGKALATVPMLGPFALSEGAQLGRGDIAGTATDIATLGALPEAIKGSFGEVRGEPSWIAK